MKQENQEEAIVHQVQLLEDLVQRQQRLIGTATEIIDMKSRLIELCEEETEIYRADNKRLRTSLIICGVVLILNVIVHLISLAH